MVYFQIGDSPHGSGAIIVFNPSEEDLHSPGYPVWASSYIRFAIAKTAFVEQQKPVRDFLRADVLRQVSRSCLACELFEPFSILKLCHMGQVQVILFPVSFFKIVVMLFDLI
jgi:hypothetical protein